MRGPRWVGTFTEILRPDVRRYETLSSSPDRSEDIATLATNMSDTDGDERHMDRHDGEPVLREGTDFLRDRGLEVGCFANRYVTVEDAAGCARS